MIAKIRLSASAEGGCHCGAVRYKIGPCEADSAYCHCRTCQRTAGAPVLAWVSIIVSAFQYTGATPSIYRSGPASQREFCGVCGTQVLYRNDLGRSVDVNTVTLDDPTLCPPQYHIWRMSRISWFDTADHLPRFDDQGPDS
jgi:hypothetical protein